MARRTALDRSHVPPDGPSHVEVTITVTPRAGSRTRPEKPAAGVVARPRTTIALLIAIAAIAAIGLHAGRPVAGAHTSPAQDAQPAGIRAAYGDPPACVNVTVSASNRAYASVHIDHHPGCSGHRGEPMMRGPLASDEARYGPATEG
jgi:hypothetical protein